jgi:hypothetical protein
MIGSREDKCLCASGVINYLNYGGTELHATSAQIEPSLTHSAFRIPRSAFDVECSMFDVSTIATVQTLRRSILLFLQSSKFLLLPPAASG